MLKSLLNSLKNKILTMIQRAAVTDEEPHLVGTYPVSQVIAMKKTSDMERIAPYGIASVPPKDSLAVKFNVQGQSSNQVGIAYDPATIPAHIAGEVVVGAFSADISSYLVFTTLGTIEVWRGGELVITDLITHVHTGVTTGPGLSGPPAL
ncbi:MAG: phage baseplate assembly protein [Phycisphaerales bacterium]|jgi:hypothetical protein